MSAGLVRNQALPDRILRHDRTAKCNQWRNDFLFTMLFITVYPKDSYCEINCSKIIGHSIVCLLKVSPVPRRSALCPSGWLPPARRFSTLPQQWTAVAGRHRRVGGMRVPDCSLQVVVGLAFGTQVVQRVFSIVQRPILDPRPSHSIRPQATGL